MNEWEIVWRLGLALALSSAIGLEREMRQKAAGLRTNALVGVGSAAFMLVSTYGFGDVIGSHVTLDPSRVAAQIVSGIGFIGGGIIFVRRDIVRGLTTAAAVWVTAAVGMACGGDLPVVAGMTTLIYLVVAYLFAPLTRFLPTSRFSPSEVQLAYLQGRGTLREALAVCAQRGFTITDLDIKGQRENGAGKEIKVTVELRGPGSLTELGTELTDLEGMLRVHAADVNE